MDKQKIEITGDEAALEFLAGVDAGRLNAADIDLSFKDWPRLHIKLTGDKFNNTLTPSVMEGFIALQKSIHKSYSLAKYGNTSKRLTQEEKELLEFSVTVEEGSSETDVDLQAVFNNMAVELANMDSEQKLIFLVVAALVTGASWSFRKYLDSRVKTRRSELESQKSAEQKEIRIHELDNMQFMAEADLEKTKILASVIDKSPTLAPLEDIAETAKSEILRSVRLADEVVIQGASLSAGVVQELKTNARKKAKEEAIAGVFVVQGVLIREPSHYRVNLLRLGSKEKITATIPSDGSKVAGEIRDAIKEAEWSRKPIDCVLSVRMAGDNITAAAVSSAKIKEQK